MSWLSKGLKAIGGGIKKAAGFVAGGAVKAAGGLLTGGIAGAVAAGASHWAGGIKSALSGEEAQSTAVQTIGSILQEQGQEIKRQVGVAATGAGAALEADRSITGLSAFFSENKLALPLLGIGGLLIYVVARRR